MVAVLLIFKFNIEKGYCAINRLHEIADETINLRIVKADLIWLINNRWISSFTVRLTVGFYDG